MNNNWLNGWTRKLGEKRLAMAMTAMLLAGAAHCPAMAANTYTASLNGSAADRNMMKSGDSVIKEGGKKDAVIYRLQDGTAFDTKMGCVKFLKDSTGTINVGKDGKGTLKVRDRGNGGNVAFHVTDRGNLTVNGNIKGTVATKGYSANGIAMVRYGEGQGDTAHMAFNSWSEFLSL